MELAMSAILQNPVFTDDSKAREWLEARVWPNGPICPHCGNMDQTRITALRGKAHRAGVYQCNETECREQFTVTVGTVFERSKIPLSKWLAALFLMVSSKKGVSAHQVHRMLGISYKSTWFMMHRLREAMRPNELAPLGGGGGTVEIDETVQGRVEGAPKRKNIKGGRSGYRNVALTLVERGGSARSFHVTGTTIAELKPVILANVAREAKLMTDQAAWYPEIGRDFASHDSVNHAKDEYVRREGDKLVTTNTVEGYYSIFKRGMKGVYQHCKEKHLHRYLAEFDFRYTHRSARGVEDAQRASILAKGIVGKRLTYRPPHNREASA
jgi:transposase-like protein